MAYLWNIIYNDYVKLKFEATDQADEEAVVTEEKPPPQYPNLENLTILVHGKRLK